VGRHTSDLRVRRKPDRHVDTHGEHGALGWQPAERDVERGT
jgi:hypothetical protein